MKPFELVFQAQCVTGRAGGAVGSELPVLTVEGREGMKEICEPAVDDRAHQIVVLFDGRLRTAGRGRLTALPRSGEDGLDTLDMGARLLEVVLQGSFQLLALGAVNEGLEYATSSRRST